MWHVRRKKPYTATGIKKLKCIRCQSPAVSQWQICADGNNYRVLCAKCDDALNEMVLRWAKHPNQKALISAYKQKE